MAGTTGRVTVEDVTLRRPVVLVGPPGSGKSTVGAMLADRLGVSCRDSDDDIEARTGREIAEIFAADGEPAFRDLEEETIAAGLAEHEGVYALGGGAVLSDTTRKRLDGYPVVFLSVGMPEGVRRTGMSVPRPVLAGLNPRATYKALLEARLPIYRTVATLEIDTDDRSPEEIVDVLLEHSQLGEPAAEGAETS